jgi:hypothetical protein
MDICKEAIRQVLLPLKEFEEDRETGVIRINPDFFESMQEGFVFEAYQEEGDEYLGRYFPMSSPGTIELNCPKLRGFFWYIIDRLQRSGHIFWKSDLEGLAHLTVHKTWWHEHFHLFSDIQSYILQSIPGSRTRDLEEALATAFSYIQIMRERKKWQTIIGRIHANIFAPFLRNAFNFLSPGYQDWPQYDDKIRFADGLVTHFAPVRASWLESNGVFVGDLLAVQLEMIFMVRKREVLI